MISYACMLAQLYPPPIARSSRLSPRSSPLPLPPPVRRSRSQRIVRRAASLLSRLSLSHWPKCNNSLFSTMQPPSSPICTPHPPLLLSIYSSMGQSRSSNSWRWRRGRVRRVIHPPLFLPASPATSMSSSQAVASIMLRLLFASVIQHLCNIWHS